MAKILVVDDRSVNREFLVTLLGYVGHTVLEASDGAEALATVRAQHPDLVITDLMMPTMGGVEFAQHIREDAAIAETPIVFYTATYKVSEAQRIATECGAVTVLVKPVEPQEVLDTVAAALGSRGLAHVSPELSANAPGLLGARLPDYLRSLTELQRSLRQRLDEAIVKLDEKTDAQAAAHAGIDAIYPFALRLAALLELKVVLTTERDAYTMLTLFCRSSQDIMNCRYVALAVMDEGGTRLKHLEARGFAADIAETIGETGASVGAFQQVMASSRSLRIDDVRSARAQGIPPPLCDIEGILIVPIPVRSATHVAGWVFLGDKLGRHAFDLEDERFAVTMAAQFAVSYGNLILFEDVHRHAAALEKEIAQHRLTTEALAESEKRFRQIATHVDAVFLLIEPDSSRIHYVNPAYERIWGLACAALHARPRAWLDAIHPDDREAAMDTIIGRSSSGLGFAIEMRIVQPDGKERWVDLRGFPIRADRDGSPYRTAIVATDVTATKRAIAVSRESDRRLKEMLDQAQLIAVMLRRDGTMSYCNDYFARLTGWSREQIIDADFFDLLVPPAEHADRRRNLDRLFANDPALQHQETGIVVRSGERRLIRWNNTLLRSAAGEVSGFAALGEDVTDQRRAEAELAHAATHDRTTGLPRLLLIEDFLQTACVEAAAKEGRVIVLYVDIDRFHATNETRGRAAGDHVLRTVAQRLRSLVEPGGRVAHVAGDEFAMVIKEKTPAQDQVEFGETVRMWIEQPIDFEDQHIYVTGSVGVSCFPDNGSDPQELLRQSESAMLRAKREGRNTVVAFANEDKQALDDRHALGLRLNDALRRGEFLLHYQPRISGQDWRIRGFEALLRWQSPEFGFLTPGRFLGVAEDMGIMVEVGSYVLNSACRQAREWIDSGADDFSISINVSPAHMQRPGFVHEVRRALSDWKVPARYLELELIENMMTSNVERMINTMRALSALGVKLSLDDFGTGYSSLTYLRQFPIDTLKIDQSFVRDISTDAGASGVCRAIITLAHQFGMTVLAEGVETAAQVGYLRRNECDFFQGFYFCKPISAAQALEMLQHRYLVHEELDQATTEQPTLLLVDDEENILSSLTRMLRRDGYRILTATDAQTALEILGREYVQVVISDQRMPGVSGTELLSMVKDMYPDTVRMVLSGYTDLAAVTAAINQGAIYKFLTKPWDDEELRMQVRDAFRIAQRALDSRRTATS